MAKCGEVVNFLIIYYIIINIVLFVMMGLDKSRAVKNRWRIPESYLFITALLGGALGGFAGMYVFRHKTKKIYFAIIYFLAFILHLVFIYTMLGKFLLK